ncbi:hypothetical protein HYT84_04080 [Candidatus Micrarchaeota archaeon]|nr:hypothetical protein [Candidatus Micrarchaeota archaeon]
MIQELVLILVVSFVITYTFTSLLIPRLKRFGLTGKDVNKPDKQEVAEMGGIAVVAGFTGGILLAVFLNSFSDFSFNLVNVLAALITIHSIAFIGIIDDLLDIPQYVKAFLPLFAAVPLVAVSAAGSTELIIPFYGPLDLGPIYIFILIPIGVAVASNLTNMLAGFNGLESGMGTVIFISMTVLALFFAKTEMVVLFLPMIGALLGFLPHNLFPAKIFPGDIGNLTIGAVLAAGVIIGNMETAGALLLSLYVLDFFIKLKNHFPSKEWWGEFRDGKLYPVSGRVRGLCQLIMKLFNGVSESRLTMVLLTLQILISTFVVAVFITSSFKF